MKYEVLLRRAEAQFKAGNFETAHSLIRFARREANTDEARDAIEAVVEANDPSPAAVVEDVFGPEDFGGEDYPSDGPLPETEDADAGGD